MGDRMSNVRGSANLILVRLAGVVGAMILKVRLLLDEATLPTPEMRGSICSQRSPPEWSLGRPSW